MKQLFTGFLLCCLSLYSFAQEFVTPSNRVLNTIQVRASPDTNGAIVGQLNPSQELEYLGSIAWIFY